MRLTGLVLAVATLVAFGTAPTTAVAETSPVARAAGTSGFCPGDDGTTVVVDLTDLGGDVIVRCAPGSESRTGLEALQAAGFDVEGTTRFGQSAVCRINGLPAADKKLAVDGDPGYRESCVDMPPAAAYWGYWHAENNGDWTYSQQGANSRAASTGGFEGWSFALNSTASQPPEPRIAPTRPATTDDPESDTDDSDDSDNSDGSGGGQTEQPERSDDADGQTQSSNDRDDASRSESSGKNLPKPMKRDSNPPPTSGTQNGVEWSGGDDEAQEAASSSSDDSDSGAMPWVAASVILVLAALITGTAVRRRTRSGQTSP